VKPNQMPRSAWPILLLGAALALGACTPKPKNGECKTSADCASQAGYGKVCVDGRCQECGQDGDCQAGFVCKANKCSPKPQCAGDLDCPAGQLCQGDRCVARPAGTCGSDRDCAEGTCQNGRCVVAQAAAAPEPEPAPAPAPAIPAECMNARSFTIHFDFDRAQLSPDAEATLQKLSDCLRAAPARRVVVQGNCDDRGTTQYNLALGSRRAEAARKYLSDLGVGGVETVSFGEERPVCSERNETCWSRNRRDDFQLER
jgi:peptidoglycan-associated lipoprotein